MTRSAFTAFFKRSAAIVAVVVMGIVSSPASAATETREFLFKGAEETFTVPPAVTGIDVTAIGSPGRSSGGASGGRGATVSGTLAVTPGQALYVAVGGNAIEGTGFNGGGYGTYSGGGASDIRTVPRASVGTLGSRLISAAGGGGAGDFNGRDADVPYAGASCTPATATAIAGGAGAGGGFNGELGSGGEGYGGGGGGLYGGGGSGYLGCAQAMGGGGGFSLVPPGGSKDLVPIATPTAVRITYFVPDVPAQPATPGTPGQGDRIAPVIERLAVSPAAFLAANTGPAVSAAVGGAVFYRLSEAATVAFTVERALKGRRSGKRCVAKGDGKPCTRFVKTKGGFSHSGAAGLNELRFMGRLGNRSLKPGSYRLVAVASDAAGNRSHPVRRTFRIVD